MTEALHAIREQRAGSMTESERKEIYQLISAAASALSADDRRKGAVATAAAAAAKTAEAERFAKRQRVAVASKDAGARLNMGALQCLKGDVAAKCLAFLRAEDFRSLAQIKCDEVSAGVLRSGVSKACDAIAPYASPPQLMIGSGWEPLAVLEDAMARADSFYASQPRRPWFRLLRVRPLSMVGEAGTPDFESDDEGGFQRCTPFNMNMTSYCNLDDCPVTAPRPRCERDATVAAAVVEILRRAPDKLARHARTWLADWLSKYLEGDNPLAGLCLDGETPVPTQTRLWRLSAAGFAPAMKAAFEQARLVATVNALADGFLAVRETGHLTAILAADRVHLYQWRDLARVALEALLSCTSREDGSQNERQFVRLWDFLRPFCFAVSRIHVWLLPPDVMWSTICQWDPDTPIIAWGVSQMTEPASIVDDKARRVARLSCVMRHLARYVPAAARRILSLGGLEASDSLLDSDVLSLQRHIKAIKELRDTLLDATRPPAEPTQGSFPGYMSKHTNQLIGWPDDLDPPLGDPYSELY